MGWARGGHLQRPVEELVARHYGTAKLVGHARLWRRRRGRPRPLLVYQMGKVASQSVAASVATLGIPVYQVHNVTSEGLRRAEEQYRVNWTPDARDRVTHVWRGQWVNREIARRPRSRWQVITVVRDPVARNVSSFFQVADLRYRLDLGHSDAVGDADRIAGVRQLFLDVFDSHDVPLGWLQEELQATFDVDVYSRAFPTGQGFMTYRSERADVLLIRYEDLARVFPAAVHALLGGPHMELASTNVSREKAYGDVYSSVARNLTLPEEYLDRMYASAYARHFYTDLELDDMRARWQTSR